MTEHVHEWYYATDTSYSELTIAQGWKCRHCPEFLFTEEAERRVNATEFLVALDARNIRVFLSNELNLHEFERGLLASYAAALEGEDD